MWSPREPARRLEAGRSQVQIPSPRSSEKARFLRTFFIGRGECSAGLAVQSLQTVAQSRVAPRQGVISLCVKLRHDDDRATTSTVAAGGRTAMSDAGLVIVGLTIAVGIVGVVLPVLPGALLAWAAIAVWALAVGSATAWAVLAIATLSIGLAQVVKVLVPGRRLRDAGVPRASILAGVLLAVVCFFLVPTVGLFIGFPLGVYLQE